jgi:hypothetical protein
LAGFVGSLSATWRTFLLRLFLTLVVLGLGWWRFAPDYAQLLMLLGRPVIPLIERGVEAPYRVDGATIVVTRSVLDPTLQKPVTYEFDLWKGYASYDLILLAALIVATPGWSLRQRVRLLGLGLVLITLTELAFFLSTIEFSRLRPLQSPTGLMLVPAGSSWLRQVVFTWIYYFFQAMGRGLFPLLIYAAMVGFTWEGVGGKAPRRARGAARKAAKR